jgi:hypothetical protein
VSASNHRRLKNVVLRAVRQFGEHDADACRLADALESCLGLADALESCLGTLRTMADEREREKFIAALEAHYPAPKATA